MTLTIMRKTFKIKRPRIMNYVSHLNIFPKEEFRKSLIETFPLRYMSKMTMGSLGFVK